MFLITAFISYTGSKGQAAGMADKPEEISGNRGLIQSMKGCWPLKKKRTLKKRQRLIDSLLSQASNLGPCPEHLDLEEHLNSHVLDLQTAEKGNIKRMMKQIEECFCQVDNSSETGVASQQSAQDGKDFVVKIKSPRWRRDRTAERLPDGEQDDCREEKASSDDEEALVREKEEPGRAKQGFTQDGDLMRKRREVLRMEEDLLNAEEALRNEIQSLITHENHVLKLKVIFRLKEEAIEKDKKIFLKKLEAYIKDKEKFNEMVDAIVGDASSKLHEGQVLSKIKQYFDQEKEALDAERTSLNNQRKTLDLQMHFFSIVRESFYKEKNLFIRDQEYFSKRKEDLDLGMELLEDMRREFAEERQAFEEEKSKLNLDIAAFVKEREAFKMERTEQVREEITPQGDGGRNVRVQEGETETQD